MARERFRLTRLLRHENENPDSAAKHCRAWYFRVPSPRLERGTYCLGGSRSIHLSYEGECLAYLTGDGGT